LLAGRSAPSVKRRSQRRFTEGGPRSEKETIMVTRNSGAAAPRRSANRAARQAKIAPATTQEASGAIIEPSVAKLPNHPAVDANPREGTTVEQNQIDFNDPTKDQAEAVADNLRKGG
jgi:hypothetical protein